MRGAAELTVSVPASTMTTTSAFAASQSNPSSRSLPIVPSPASQPARPGFREPVDEHLRPLELLGPCPAPDRLDRHADELLPESIRGEVPLVAVGRRRARRAGRTWSGR